MTGNRTTYICTVDDEFVGEINLVKETLVDFITEKAKTKAAHLHCCRCVA